MFDINKEKDMITMTTTIDQLTAEEKVKEAINVSILEALLDHEMNIEFIANIANKQGIDVYGNNEDNDYTPDEGSLETVVDNFDQTMSNLARQFVDKLQVDENIEKYNNLRFKERDF